MWRGWRVEDVGRVYGDWGRGEVHMYTVDVRV